jgi:two-component sensor histidine kinase
MDTERYLSEVFDELADAPTLAECLQVAARAAGKLTDAYGLCLLSTDGLDSLVALRGQQRLYLSHLRRTGLYRAAASLHESGVRSSGRLWGKEDFVLLPNGQHRPIEVSLIVPVTVPNFLALAIFWQAGQAADRACTRQLELLARAFDLAARARSNDAAQAAHQRDQARISTELQRRVRNNLALVRSIIRRSNETADSAEHFALHLEARMSALTRIQGALVTAGTLGVELEELVRTELIANAVPGRQYAVQGPAVRLHDKGAELLALAIHELVTNSLKFGALATASGHLLVRWSVTDSSLQLSWSESGVTIASAAPRRRGFGQELIECTLPYQLGGHSRLEFGPGTVACDIDIPLDEQSATIAPAVILAHAASS